MYMTSAEQPSFSMSRKKWSKAMQATKELRSERKRWALQDKPDGRLLDLVETAKAHINAQVEHQFRVIKKQFSFGTTRLHGIARSHYKVNALAAPSNLHLAREYILATG